MIKETILTRLTSTFIVTNKREPCANLKDRSRNRAVFFCQLLSDVVNELALILRIGLTHHKKFTLLLLVIPINLF